MKYILVACKVISYVCSRIYNCYRSVSPGLILCISFVVPVIQPIQMDFSMYKKCPCVHDDQALALNHCTVDDSCFHHIAALSNLTSLALMSTPVTKASNGVRTRSGRSCRNGISRANSEEDTSDEESMICLPKLVYLNLRDTNWLLEAGMSQFCGNVKTMLLGSQHIQIKNMKNLSELCSLRDLRLEVGFCPIHLELGSRSCFARSF